MRKSRATPRAIMICSFKHPSSSKLQNGSFEPLSQWSEEEMNKSHAESHYDPLLRTHRDLQRREWFSRSYCWLHCTAFLSLGASSSSQTRASSPLHRSPAGRAAQAPACSARCCSHLQPSRKMHCCDACEPLQRQSRNVEKTAINFDSKRKLM